MELRKFNRKRKSVEHRKEKVVETKLVAIGVYKVVELTANGYLVDAHEWDEEVARAILLAEHGIEMAEDHLSIIRMVREDTVRHGSAPSGRWIYTQAGGYSKLKRLFSSNAPVATVLQCCGFPEPRE